jgi:hypothetical protein
MVVSTSPSKFETAGAEDAFAEPRKQPVSRHFDRIEIISGADH